MCLSYTMVSKIFWPLFILLAWQHFVLTNWSPTGLRFLLCHQRPRPTDPSSWNLWSKFLPFHFCFCLVVCTRFWHLFLFFWFQGGAKQWVRGMGTYSFCHVCWLWKLLKRFLTVFVTLFCSVPWHVYFMLCCRRPGPDRPPLTWPGDLNAPMTCSSGKHPTCPSAATVAPAIRMSIMQFSGHLKPARNENGE